MARVSHWWRGTLVEAGPLKKLCGEWINLTREMEIEGEGRVYIEEEEEKWREMFSWH